MTNEERRTLAEATDTVKRERLARTGDRWLEVTEKQVRAHNDGELKRSRTALRRTTARRAA